MVTIGINAKIIQNTDRFRFHLSIKNMFICMSTKIQNMSRSHTNIPVIFLTKNCIRLMRHSFLSEKYLSTMLSFSTEAGIDEFSVIEIR